MLEGKLAIITGAGSGIGRATARRFAAEGATVIAADVDLERARQTCEGLSNATAKQADVTRREDIEALVAGHDRIDVYFNNAGVPARIKPLAELTRDVRVNVINPGPANTPMLEDFGFATSPAEALSLKRLIEPEDIAGAAAYLASDDARAITGAVFNVDGGRDL